MRRKGGRNIFAAIGIDPSKSNCGFAIKTKKGEFVDSISADKVCGVFPRAKLSHTHFCHYQSMMILSYIHKIVPSVQNCFIVMENYAFGAVGRTFDLAELSGMIKHSLFIKNKLPMNSFYLCTTQHLKMYLASKGNLKKELIIKEVFKQWGFDTDINDEADAYVLMKIAESLAWGGDISTYRQDILQRIKKHNGR